MARLTGWFRALTRRRVLVIAACTLVAVWGGTTVVAFAYDRVESDHLLPGTTIAGVDVGGMSRDEAIRAVRVRVRHELREPIAVHAGESTFQVVPLDVGVTGDVEGAVDRALESSDSMTWVTRSYHRLFGWSVSKSIPLTNWLPQRRIDKLVDHLVARIDREPRGAGIVMSKDRMRVVKQHARKGYEADPDAVRTDIVAALRTLHPSVSVHVRITKPKISDDDLNKTVAVDLSSNELHLYDGFHMVKTYPVATAQPGFTTPAGRWHVIDKVENPDWTNPDPTGWGAGEPLYIPPGPSNPLGLRALYLNASGIRIHGTPDSGSIGSYASHGCIRMLEDDVIALYPQVPRGTPVVIYGSPPWGVTATSGVPG
ncbi:MAG: L,D-transpeptidase family protein [Actinomycetota bacterium]